MNLRTSALARMIVMAFILTALLIPLSMVEGVVSERATRREAVVQEFGGTWGGPQTIAGPVLTIPYRYNFTDNAGRPREGMGRATFLPDALDIRGVVNPRVRNRGLFSVVVYNARLQVAGRFARPDLANVRPSPVQPHWEDAALSIGISDPRGIARRIAVKWNGTDAELVPGVDDVGIVASGLRAKVPGLADAPVGGALTFALDVEVNGSRDLRFLPAGSDTSVQLTSSWPHPSFTGAPIPQSRSVNDAGFTAAWSVPYFGRSFPSSWTSVEIDREKLKTQADASTFGVSLIQPVDIYQQSERAIKYAALLIVMTFVVFFLWETVRARLLHPVQYLFVGFAMCVFYLLLVSVSEHLGFDVAYGLAASATTLLIAMYSTYILGGLKEGASMLFGLVALYGFLYLLLRLEDYALIAGSVGLFLMLALLMYATRRVNWYDLKLGDSASADRSPLSADR